MPKRTSRSAGRQEEPRVTSKSESVLSRSMKNVAPKPHINPNVFKENEFDSVREELRERQYDQKRCEYCSLATEIIKHQHFSSSRQRDFALHWTNSDFMCPVCHVFESPILDKDINRRVILSDSTLYGIWDHPNLPQFSSHFDIECIVGGRIKDLARALKRNLLTSKGRLEVILVGGISNVEYGDSVATIMEQIKELKEMVKDHSKFNGHNVPGYVSVATLPLPPKFCSLRLPENPTNLQEWVPKPGFTNMYPIIQQVNTGIKEINMEDSLAYLNIHMQGIRMLKSGPQHKFDTKEGSPRIWREKNVFEKCHFTMENKLKLVKYLGNTFASNEAK